MKKDEFLLRRKTIYQKLIKLINSDLGEEFLNGCEDFNDAMQKFELKYGFLI